MYSPIRHLTPGQWVLGRLENDQARALSCTELTDLCERLNRSVAETRPVDSGSLPNWGKAWSQTAPEPDPVRSAFREQVVLAATPDAIKGYATAANAARAVLEYLALVEKGLRDQGKTP